MVLWIGSTLLAITMFYEGAESLREHARKLGTVESAMPGELMWGNPSAHGSNSSKYLVYLIPRPTTS